ncbi:hypothetical protein LF934_09365 [Dickeya dadantii]|uniref:hypothetical protein n=1 Tax=Dickeya dadantii TaxID=204038 RepID=UPI001CF194E1|nr:hypothetical protein [Dickeya dadantii]MCA7012852.1 hypothetical protein [Dickeya dadantii]
MKKQSQDTFLALLFPRYLADLFSSGHCLKSSADATYLILELTSAMVYPVNDAEQLSLPDRNPRGEIPRGMPSLTVGPACFDTALTSITYLIKIISIATQHQDHIHTPR